MNDYDLATAQGVADYMSEATTQADWDNRIRDVKAANGGDYPIFWYGAVIASGLTIQTAKKWGSSGRIEIEATNVSK